MSERAGPEPAAAGAVRVPSAEPVDEAGAGPATPTPRAAVARPVHTGSAPVPAPTTSGRPGHQVVLGLFVVLAACVIIVFSVFALSVRPEDRGWIPELTARYLYMPVVATGILVAIDAWRAGAPRWWVFLLTAPIPVVNVVLAAAWILKWRHMPAAGD